MKGTLSVKKILSAMLLIVALMALAACGGEAATTAPTSGPATGGETTGGAAGAALNFDSGQAAENIYIPAAAEATAGEVTVTFNNVSAQPHNWTLVKQGEEDTAVAESLKDTTNYTYAGAIAQTKLIQAGAGKDTVTLLKSERNAPFIAVRILQVSVAARDKISGDVEVGKCDRRYARIREGDKPEGHCADAHRTYWWISPHRLNASATRSISDNIRERHSWTQIFSRPDDNSGYQWWFCTSKHCCGS